MIASTPFRELPEYGWVMFVAVTSWLITIILFFVILFGVQRKLQFVPWTLTVRTHEYICFKSGSLLRILAAEVRYPLDNDQLIAC